MLGDVAERGGVMVLGFAAGCLGGGWVRRHGGLGDWGRGETEAPAEPELLYGYRCNGSAGASPSQHAVALHHELRTEGQMQIEN